MPVPVIAKGEHVSLRIFTKDDIPLIWENINDPEMTRFLRYPDGIYYYEDEVEWYENLRKGKQKNRVFLVVDNSSNEPVGSVGLHSIDYLSRHAELGYLIFKPHWNKRYATEAAALIMDYARHTLNLRKIYAFVKGSNIASSRVLEKNGFQSCGAFKEHEYVPGKGFVDLIAYEKFFDE